MPDILYRSSREQWAAEGSRTLTQKAEQIAQQLMANEVDCSLDDHQLAELDKLAQSFVDGL